MNPSPHVSWQEVNCHDGTPYPDEWVYPRLYPLLDVFESLREIWGAPIKILSCYRTPEYNARIGGAPSSQHVQGRALDLTPADPFLPGRDVASFHQFIKSQLPFHKLIRGCGTYHWGNHIDTRPTQALAVW